MHPQTDVHLTGYEQHLQYHEQRESPLALMVIYSPYSLRKIAFFRLTERGYNTVAIRAGLRANRTQDVRQDFIAHWEQEHNVPQGRLYADYIRDIREVTKGPTPFLADLEGDAAVVREFPRFASWLLAGEEGHFTSSQAIYSRNAVSWEARVQELNNSPELSTLQVTAADLTHNPQAILPLPAPPPSDSEEDDG